MELGNSVYSWWYWGLGGLGGWAVFLLLGIAAAAYVFFDSSNRSIKAAGWRLAALLPLILFIPGILFRFSNPMISPIESRASEWFLVLGVLGAIVTIASAVGYGVSYAGVTPLPSQGQPFPTRQQVPPPPIIRSELPPPPEPSRRVSSRSARETVPAWLVNEATGRQHILYKGDTRIGRRSDNDLVLDDPTVSREHVLIRAEGNVFTLYDRGSSAGTIVNGRRVREPVILYHGDTIELGDVKLTFVTSQR